MLIPITSAKGAANAARNFTGFSQEKEGLAERRESTVVEVPFLPQSATGGATWSCTFDTGPLILKSATPGFADWYNRRFEVYMASSGNLLKVVADSESNLPRTSLKSYEEQLCRSGEKFVGFPDEMPKLGVLDALDVCLARGVASPFLAKRIELFYVLHQHVRWHDRPVWIVTLTGVPTIPIIGPARLPNGLEISDLENSGNCMRAVVDANSGQFLFAINKPSPDIF